MIQILSSIQIRSSAVALLLLLPTMTFGQDWKRIIPIESSRRDVERIMGSCEEGSIKSRCLYELEKMNVIVNYVVDECSSGGAWNVPVGTVEGVTVHFRPAARINGYIDPRDAFVEEDDPELPGIKHFRNKEKGIYYVTEGPALRSIYYSPAKAEEKKCR